MNLPWHLYLMATLYIVAGMSHFINPRLYLKIIPPYFPKPRLLNKISGLAEIIFGALLLIPSFTVFAALGIILLLLAVFPANIYMYQNYTAHPGIPKWILLLRLPLQAVLIYWAFQYVQM